VDTTIVVGGGLLVAIVLIVLLVRQLGTRQQLDVTASVFGAKGRVKSSIDPEMEGIKAGRDVKAIAGDGDPARMSKVEAGRDVIRDTSGRNPKA